MGSSKEYTEEQAIAALKRVAKRWPKDKLWLYSASGSLCVMKAGPDGEQVEKPGFGAGVDPAYLLDYIDIPNDGGDW